MLSNAVKTTIAVVVLFHQSDAKAPLCYDSKWTDSLSNSCQMYEEFKLCNPNKTTGPGWQPKWGSIQSLAADHLSAYEACCACGKNDVPGQTKKTNVVVSTSPTSIEYNKDSRPRPRPKPEVTTVTTPTRAPSAQLEPKGQMIIKEKVVQICVDHPKTWQSRDGETCTDYIADDYCTSEGRPGPGWETDWGYFESWAKPNSVAAHVACCGCGGGKMIDVVVLAKDDVGGPGEGCQNLPRDWVSGDGETCATYATKKYCTKSGKPGTGWQASWGSFDSFKDYTYGMSANDACCNCGGGTRYIKFKPATDTPTAVPTLEVFDITNNNNTTLNKPKIRIKPTPDDFDDDNYDNYDGYDDDFFDATVVSNRDDSVATIVVITVTVILVTVLGVGLAIEYCKRKEKSKGETTVQLSSLESLSETTSQVTGSVQNTVAHNMQLKTRQKTIWDQVSAAESESCDDWFELVAARERCDEGTRNKLETEWLRTRVRGERWKTISVCLCVCVCVSVCICVCVTMTDTTTEYEGERLIECM